MTERINNVEVQGMKEISELFRSLPVKLGSKTLRSVLRKSAAIMQQAAIAKAPERTGALKASIRIASGRVTDPESALVYVYTGLYYGRMLETGTRKMSAHPFMGPAFDATDEEFIQLFLANAAAALDRIFKKMNPEDLSGQTLGEFQANQKALHEQRKEINRLKGEYVRDYFSAMGPKYGKLGEAEIKQHRSEALKAASKLYNLGTVKPRAKL